MAELVQCPGCASWNPPKATRCSVCGRELRGADVRFEGPPADAIRATAARDETLREERRAARTAASMKAMREAKREELRKRKEYAERKARLEEEIAEERRRGKGIHGPRATHPKAPEEEPPTEAVGPPRTSEAPHPDSRAHGRVATHVRGLDEALGGGIPRGFVVVIEGTPGTMKSTLGFWILAHNCAANGSRAVYLSFEENAASLLRQMEAVGIGVASTGDRLKILDPPLLQRAFRAERRGDWLEALQGLLPAGEGKPDLVVLDSLDALHVLAKLDDPRREWFRLFEWLRDLGATTFVIAERPDYVIQGNVFMGRYDEDFLADGVLNLRLHLVGDQDCQRRIRIVKMRGTRHETGYLALHVGDGELEVGRVLSG